MPSAANRCIASRLTAAGRSAIATVGIAGPNAAYRAASCFQTAHGQSLEQFPRGRIVFGIWRRRDTKSLEVAAEEVVVHRVSESRVDVHCHGGHSAAARILADLAYVGIETVDWPAWLAATENDVIAAEARFALTSARTARTAALLLDQSQGALRAALRSILDALAREQLDLTRERLDQLLDRASCGLHLAAPWKVVLTGLPNAGKSSLINALVGYRRAIVHDQPGTTRDVVAATTVLDGWPVELSDTAGLRDTGDPIESAGVERAREKLKSADLVVLVHDASLAWSPADQQLFESTRAELIAFNKSDLTCMATDDRPPGIFVSASKGAGVETLAAAIIERLAPNPPRPGDAIPFTPRQIGGLQAAGAYLSQGFVEQARSALEQV